MPRPAWTQLPKSSIRRRPKLVCVKHSFIASPGLPATLPSIQVLFVQQDLVIGIDLSTSGTKATAWDKAGVLVAEARESIPYDQSGTGSLNKTPPTGGASCCCYARAVMDQSIRRGLQRSLFPTNAKPLACFTKTALQCVQRLSGSMSAGWMKPTHWRSVLDRKKSAVYAVNLWM